jgi:predicted protein tyrosine phosphatase
MKTANFPRSYIIETYGRFPFHCDEEDWLISIADPAAYNAVPKARFDRVLFMNFADVEEDNCGGIGEDQAAQIADFIKEARTLKKNVWVNCHMGMCRSGAVVRLLGELGWEIASYSGQPERIPNLRVYEMVRKHFPELQQSWDDESSDDLEKQLSPGEMWDKFVEYYRKKVGIEEITNIMGGVKALRKHFIDAQAPKE